jgi:hypothetical protein
MDVSSVIMEIERMLIAGYLGMNFSGKMVSKPNYSQGRIL